MNQELVQKIHEEKYLEQMSYDDYMTTVKNGLEVISTTGINNAENGHAVNLALEYNIELMTSLLAM